MEFEKIIRKLKDYFFMTIDKGTASSGNRTLFTKLKENYTLIKHFGPMYIDFDEHPPYTGTISKFLEQMLIIIFGVIAITLIL